MRSFMKTHLRNSPIFDRQKSPDKDSNADDIEPISPIKLGTRSHHHHKKSHHTKKALAEDKHKSHSSFSSIDTEILCLKSAQCSPESPTKRLFNLKHKRHSSDGSKITGDIKVIKQDINNPFLTQPMSTKRKHSVNSVKLPSASSSSLPSLKSNSSKGSTLSTSCSVDNIAKQPSFKVYPYTNFPPIPDRSTTIYGTKTHNWGLVDMKEAQLKRPFPFPQSRVPVAPPLPKDPVRLNNTKSSGLGLSSSIPRPRSSINTGSSVNSVDNGAIDGSKSPLSLARKSTSLTDTDMSSDNCVPKYSPEALLGSRAIPDDNSRNDEDDPEASDSDSSKFSFQLTGRNASVKYYKTKEQVKDEQEVKSEKKNVDRFVQFINSSEPLEQLDDDLNYIDMDAKDETDDLFNRDLFSDDEEEDKFDDNLPPTTNRKQNALLVAGGVEKAENHNDEGGKESVFKISKGNESKQEKEAGPQASPETQVNLLLEQLRSTKINADSAGLIIPSRSNCVSRTSLKSEDSTENDIFADYKDFPEDENKKSRVKLDITQNGKDSVDLYHSTPKSKHKVWDNLGSLGLKARRSKLKYHQINSKILEDNMDFIKSKYSWLGNEDETKLDAPRRTLQAGSSSVDNSILDEVNQVSSDYESDINLRNDIAENGAEQSSASVSVDQVQQSDSSIINLSKKTITLFNGVSPGSLDPNFQNSFQYEQSAKKHFNRARPYYADILENNKHHTASSFDSADTSYNPDFYDQYTESADDNGDDTEDLSFIPYSVPPRGYGECSLLTTISEASFESSRSVHSDH